MSGQHSTGHRCSKGDDARPPVPSLKEEDDVGEKKSPAKVGTSKDGMKEQAGGGGLRSRQPSQLAGRQLVVLLQKCHGCVDRDGRKISVSPSQSGVCENWDVLFIVAVDRFPPPLGRHHRHLT